MSDSAQYLQTIEASSEGSAFVDIAVSSSSQSWSFPVIYEIGVGTQPAESAAINIGGTNTPLSLGPQTVQGTGTTVTLSWVKGQSVKFGSNPHNISGTTDGYPIKDIGDEEGNFTFVLGASASNTTWNLLTYVTVQQEPEQPPPSISLLLDGSFYADVPSGPSSFLNLSASEVSLVVTNLSGASELLKILFTLTQS